MNYKNMGSSSADPHPPPPGTPLARQLSVYSLTFDEFQSTMGGMGLGKDFGSMNMDEFLKNIWTAEETQAMASASAAAAADAAAGVAGLQRQGSLTLPRTLSQKTVDEVWRDFADVQQQQQLTLGEMTLEEFLVRAGVVREDMNQPAPAPAPGPIMNNINTTVGTAANNNSMFFGELPASNSNPGLGLGFGQLGRNSGNSAASLAMSRAYPTVLPLGNATDLASPQRMRGGGMVGIGDPALSNGLMNSVVGLGGGGGVSVAMPSPTNRILSDGLAKGNGDLSSLSPAPFVFSGGLRGRKHGAVEKVVERRQKRMIKNRESAARSRARKQAYTMELEAEIAKLKEQNEELEKKQAEIMEMQKTQVLEIINQQHLPKKRCLRRTHTGPW